MPAHPHAWRKHTDLEHYMAAGGYKVLGEALGGITQRIFIQRGLLDSPVAVTTRGGGLHIAWAGDGQSVLMTGPAQRVFEGEIDI